MPDIAMPDIAMPPAYDWHVSELYDYTVELFATPWAWEYMRRNPKFQLARIQAETAIHVVSISERLTTLRASSGECPLKPWRCLFSSPPQTPSHKAMVLWHPDFCPTVLRAVAIAGHAARSRALFSLAESPLKAVLLITPDGVQHLVFRDGTRWLQLAVTGASLAEPVQITAELSVDPRVAKGQAWARQCFEDFRASGCLLEEHYPPHARSERFRECLQVLDALQAGATPREMAEVHFDAATIAAEWNDPSRRLQDWVRNAKRRAESLMEGRYQILLCDL
jgi:hypothetical protein